MASGGEQDAEKCRAQQTADAGTDLDDLTAAHAAAAAEGGTMTTRAMLGGKKLIS